LFISRSAKLVDHTYACRSTDSAFVSLLLIANAILHEVLFFCVDAMIVANTMFEDCGQFIKISFARVNFEASISMSIAV